MCSFDLNVRVCVYICLCTSLLGDFAHFYDRVWSKEKTPSQMTDKQLFEAVTDGDSNYLTALLARKKTKSCPKNKVSEFSDSPSCVFYNDVPEEVVTVCSREVVSFCIR